jgi:hypothetical protein
MRKGVVTIAGVQLAVGLVLLITGWRSVAPGLLWAMVGSGVVGLLVARYEGRSARN